MYMIELLEDLLIEINDKIENKYVLVGSLSLNFNGFDVLPKKKELDIVIIDENLFKLLQPMGKFSINENGERTPFGEKKRMMVRTHENLFIDVYLKDELPTHNFYKLKNGKTIKIADIEDYKKHYGDMMSNYDFKKYDLDGRFINKIINYTNLF